jgi:hypothetical protein
VPEPAYTIVHDEFKEKCPFATEEKPMRRSMIRAGLLAGMAMWLLASSAQAEFSLQILSNGTPTHDGFKVAETDSGYQVTTFGNVQASDVHVTSVNSSMIQVSGMVDNYQFSLVGHSNQDVSPTPSMGVVALDTTVTAKNGALPTSFSYYVADTPFTFPGTASSPIHLQASLQTFGTYISGDLVQAQAVLSSFGPSSPTLTYLTKTAGPLSQANQYATSSVMTIPTRGPEYTLGGLGGLIETQGHQGTMRFWAQAATSMPEPSGVVIGLLGVPFMGLVVVFARRRLARFSAVTA